MLLVAIVACSRLSAAALPNAPGEEQGYLKLGFNWLASFRFEAPRFDPDADPNAPSATGEEQIPPVVRAWSGRKAIVTGFMLPTKMEDGLATEFLLVRDPSMCCFGVTPAMNEWIVVRTSKGMRPLMDVPISFYGTLKVGAVLEDGCLTGIYEFQAEKMAPRE